MIQFDRLINTNYDHLSWRATPKKPRASNATANRTKWTARHFCSWHCPHISTDAQGTASNAVNFTKNHFRGNFTAKMVNIATVLRENAKFCGKNGLVIRLLTFRNNIFTPIYNIASRSILEMGSMKILELWIKFSPKSSNPKLKCQIATSEVKNLLNIASLLYGWFF